MTPREAFQAQARVCEEMGSPFTARICRLLAARLKKGDAVADRVLGWPGDPSSRADALPLRLAGALHGLVLETRDRNLAAVYPPHHGDVSDDALWAAIAGALEVHTDYVLARLEGPPQTNEVQRCNALAPGLLTVAAETGLPLVLSEIGASAGLNLLWDRFHYRFGEAEWGDPAAPVRLHPDWRGPPPPRPRIRVAGRAGCDLAPANLGDPAARIRLLSFVWADQRDRLLRTEAAIALARSTGIAVERADAADWLARRLAAPEPGVAHIVYHSITWQYLGPGIQARIQSLIAAASRRLTPEAPLAWLRLEGDGQQPGAALRLTLWPGGGTRLLARADFHGRWVDWVG